MRRILCYGDSNTWGCIPISAARYGEDIRWPGVLAGLLGAEYRIIEEGLNGRTTVFDDPLQEGRNGKTYLLPCLLSHRPLDVVVLMLGTNDMKQRYGLPAEDIARGAGVLAEIVRTSGSGTGEWRSSWHPHSSKSQNRNRHAYLPHWLRYPAST